MARILGALSEEIDLQLWYQLNSTYHSLYCYEASY